MTGLRVDEQQLRRLRETLTADGYLIEVSAQDACARVVITAQEGVCAECLVPKALMLSLLAPILGTEPDSIELSYPDDSK